jgi:hypothetical protein
MCHFFYPEAQQSLLGQKLKYFIFFSFKQELHPPSPLPLTRGHNAMSNNREFRVLQVELRRRDSGVENLEKKVAVVEMAMLKCEQE